MTPLCSDLLSAATLHMVRHQAMQPVPLGAVHYARVCVARRWPDRHGSAREMHVRRLLCRGHADQYGQGMNPYVTGFRVKARVEPLCRFVNAQIQKVFGSVQIVYSYSKVFAACTGPKPQVGSAKFNR
jgi:hypothetical protein